MKNVNLIEMLRGCSKRNGTTFRQSNPDGQPTVNRQSMLMSHRGYLKNLAMIFAVLVMSVANIGMAWGATEDIDFKTSGKTSTSAYTGSALTTMSSITFTATGGNASIAAASGSYTQFTTGTGDGVRITFTPNSGVTITALEFTLSSGNNKGSFTYSSTDATITNSSKTHTLSGLSLSSAFDIYCHLVSGSSSQSIKVTNVKVTYTTGTPRTFKSGEVIYFKDYKSNMSTLGGSTHWKNSDGNVYAKFYDASAETWTYCASYADLVSGSWNGDNAIYKITVPGSGKTYTKVIFTRGTGNTDGNTWNKTVEQTPEIGKNMFNIADSKSGDDWTGSWSKYAPNPALIGDFNNWDPDANVFKDYDGNVGVTYFTLDEASHTYDFKILQGETYYCFDDEKRGWTITGTTTTEQQLYGADNDNSQITSTEVGEYVMKYDKSTHKFKAAYYPKERLTKGSVLYFDAGLSTYWTGANFHTKFEFKRYDNLGTQIAYYFCDDRISDSEHTWVYHTNVPNSDVVGGLQIMRFDPSSSHATQWNYTNTGYVNVRSSVKENCAYITSGEASYENTQTLAWKTYCPPMSKPILTDDGPTIFGGSGTSESPYIVEKGSTIVLTASGSSSLVDDDNMTAKYQFKDGATSKQDGEETTYSLTVSSTENTVHNMSVEAYNYYNSTSGTHTASDHIYYKAMTTYTITYKKGDYGTGDDIVEKKAKGVSYTVRSSASYTRTGYNQAGWCTNSSGSGGTSYAYGASYTTNNNLTLYPTWTAKTTSVTLNPNTANHGTGSNVVATATFDGTSLTGFTAATPADGYALEGYYTAATSGTKILNANGSFVKNTTYTTNDGTPKWKSELSSLELFAHYVPKYTVTYKKNGGASGADGSVTGTTTDASSPYASGTEVTTIANSYSNSGYKFKWWNKNYGGDGEDFYIGEKFTISANTNLYAQWEEVASGWAYWCGDAISASPATYTDITGNGVTMRIGGVRGTAFDYNTGIQDATVVSKYSSTEKHANVIAVNAKNSKYVTISFTDGSAINSLKLGVCNKGGTKEMLVIYSTTADFSSGAGEKVAHNTSKYDQTSKNVIDFSPAVSNKYLYARIYMQVDEAVYGQTGGSNNTIRIYSIKAQAGSSCSAPTSPSISGTTSYTAGNTISLTASATGTSGSTTYAWYLGDPASSGVEVQAASTSGATFSKSAVVADEGTYYCVISNGDGCDVTTSQAITVSCATAPVAVTSLTCSAQTINSLTYTWTKASNASGYTATLYSDSDCKTQVSSQSLGDVSSVTFSTLSVGTTYYCKVQSKGNGTVYCVDGGTTSALSGTTLHQYTISYNAGTGDGISGSQSNQMKTEGSSFTLPGVVFTRSGYVQTGWTTSDGGTQTHTLGGSYTTDAEQTFYPVWSPVYTVTFNTNGTGSVSPITQTTYGGSISMPSGPSSTDSTFLYWVIGGNTYAASASYTPTSNITAYAAWKEKCSGGSGTEVWFLAANKNDAGANFASMSTSSNTTQLVGSGIAKLIATGSADLGYDVSNKKIGYRFDSRCDVVFKLTTTASLDIYFTSTGGSNRTCQLASFSSAKSLSDVGTSDYSTKSTVTSGVTVAGAVIETVAAGSATVSSGVVTITSSGGLKISYSSLSAGYYVFYSGSSSSMYVSGFETSAGGGGTCYYVKYDGNGAESGSINDATAYESGDNVTVLDNTGGNAFVKDGTTFAGWNTAADGSGDSKTAGGTFTITKDTVLYAQWSSCIKPILSGDPGDEVVISGSPTHNSATLAWDGVGAVAGTKSYKIYLEVKSTHSTVVDWTAYDQMSYTATGLSAETEYTFKVIPVGDPADGSYPRCEEGDVYSVDFTTDEEPTTYTVTYADGGADSGGVPEDDNAYEEGAEVTVLGNTGSLAKNGYTFAGWNDGSTDYEAGNTFDMPAKDVTLTAQWTPNTYDITYNLNGASWASSAGVASYTVGTGATLPLASAMTNTGYTFNGWKNNSGLTGDNITAIGTSEYGNKEFWAKWTENTYTVTYSANGGTGDAMSNTVGHYVTLSANTYTKSGYIFAGWNTATDGSGASYSEGEEIELKANLDLYAIWASDYDITWDASPKLSGVDAKPNLGGGNYTITASVATWTGTLTTSMISAETSGVTITGVSVNNSASPKTITATFNVGASVVGDKISFTLDVPANGSYSAKSDTEDFDIDRCTGSSGGSDGVLFSAEFKDSGLGTSDICTAANTPYEFTTDELKAEAEGGSISAYTTGELSHLKYVDNGVYLKGADGVIKITLSNAIATNDLFEYVNVHSSNPNAYLRHTSPTTTSDQIVLTGYNSRNVKVMLPAAFNEKTELYIVKNSTDFKLHKAAIVRPAFLMLVNDGASTGNLEGTNVELTTSNYLSVMKGGHVYYTSPTSGDVKITQSSSKNYITLAKTAGYLKVVLNDALQEDDIIGFDTSNGSSEICFATTTTRSTDEHTSSQLYTVGSSSPLKGQTTFYIWYYSSSTTIRGLQIARSGVAGGSGGTDKITPTLTWDTDLSGGVAAETGDADFTHTVTQDKNSLGAITYSSSNTSVATVNASGKVHIVGAGNATITATLAASGCYNQATATYNITVTDNCDDVAGTIGTEDLGCDGIRMTVTGHTGEGAGATYQWYKDGATIGATSASYTATAAGEYYVVVTNTGYGHCAMASTNTVTVAAKSAVTATKIVDSWYVKNDRRTPDVALVQTTNATDFTVAFKGSTSIWDPTNSVSTGFGGCPFRLGADGIIYLDGQSAADEAPTGMTVGDTTITITAKGCGAGNELSVDIKLHVQAATTRPSVAFVVDGTKEGAFDAENEDHSVNTALYQFLNYNLSTNPTGKFDLTGQNVYSTVDEKAIREHYSQFDAILITDDPSTDTKIGKKSCVDAFGAMIDIRPILTMEAFVAKWSNWKTKGVDGNPSSPNPRQYAMKLDCKNHAIFKNINPESSNVLVEYIDGIEYWTVTMVDSTQSPYSGVAYNSETKEKPALQGFEASDVSGLMLLGEISGGTLYAGVERQEEPAARLLLLGVNNKALPNALTPEGKKIIENALTYLIETDMEKVDDCSNYFTDKTGDHQWSTALNWSKEIVPNSPYVKARILKPCVLSGLTTQVARVDIATSGKSLNLAGGECSGSLTIEPTGALIVGGEVRSAVAPYFNTGDLMPTTEEKLVINTDKDHQAALVFNNDKGDTKATVNLYSLGRKESGSYYYQYMAVPMESLPVNPSFAGSGIYTYVWNEASGWERRGYYTDLYAFEGVGITTKFADAKTYEMEGTLASTETREIALTNDKNGQNMIGNSWTAPIQIADLKEDNSASEIIQTVYIYSTGNGNTVSDGTTASAGQWLAIPFSAAGFEEWDGLKVIPAMQTFNINVTGTSTLTLDYDKVVRKRAAKMSVDTLTTPLHAPKRSAAHEGVELMRIRVEDSQTHTDLYLFKGERFSDEFDNGWEAEYLNGDGRSAKLYAQTEIGKMAVVATDELEGTVLGFEPGKETEYTFTFGGEGMGYYLNDLKLQKSTWINAGETYSFTYEEGDINRFIISTTPITTIMTGCESVGAEAAKVRKVIIDDKVYIIRGGRIYGVDGQMVK